MKVKDLIELLQSVDPKFEVLVADEEKNLSGVYAHHIEEECVDREDWVLKEGKPNSLIIYLY